MSKKIAVILIVLFNIGCVSILLTCNIATINMLVILGCGLVNLVMYDHYEQNIIN